MLRRCSSALLLGVLLLAAGCAGLTAEEEVVVGARLHDRIRMEAPLLTDPVVTRYVEDVARDILRAAPDQAFDYRVSVIVDDDINAFAGPGGYVYLHTGTLLRARHVSELAGVLAHEIGHVERHHVSENVARQRAAGIARQVGVVAAGVAAGPAAASAASLLGGVASLAALNSFGREAEREADAYAVEILPRAGYDPEGLVTFFETLESETRGAPPAFLSSHPATAERIAQTRRLVEAQAGRAGLRRDDGGKLEIIQHRIRLLTDPSAARGGR